MPDSPSSPAEPRPPRSLPVWPLMLAIVASIVIPYIFWHQTWFGRRLLDDDLSVYLAERDKPRHLQHALQELKSRMIERPESARAHYPAIVELADHEEPTVRRMSAWVMGEDRTEESFHRKLLELLVDDDPRVRQNAALSLARFGDEAARPVLLLMLSPYPVPSPSAGRIVDVLEGAILLSEGKELARIEGSDGEVQIVRAPVDGTTIDVRVGLEQTIEEGTILLSLQPTDDGIAQALMGIHLVGTQEDLPLVRGIADGAGDRSESIRNRARQTIEAIEHRQVQNEAETGT